jgi:two-component system, cell cycle response regulator DivK
MNKFRILVVEDNRDNMTFIADVLSALGYDVIQAINGEDGLEATQREKPDLILMDLSLPVMDGWTATKEIKSNPELSNIPVIALTAHTMMKERQRAMDAGCDDYITKPIELAELRSKLEKHLEK